MKFRIDLNSRYLSFLANPFIVSAIMAAIVFVFLPQETKYLISEVESKSSLDLNYCMYYDMDGNGNSELITSLYNQLGNACMKVYDKDDRIIDQWNFQGKFPDRGDNFFFGDIDNNGIVDILLFIESGDSVMLNCISPLQKPSVLIKNYFIDTVWQREKKIDYVCHILKVADFDLDGVNDILLRVKAGFSLYPRKLYLFDWTGDSIISTPSFGNIPAFDFVEDIDDDGYLEYIGGCQAPGNIPKDMDVLYKDSSSWLMCFDHNLNFEFKPIEFEGYTSRLFAMLLKNGDEKYICVYRNYFGTDSISAGIYIYDPKGNPVKHLDIPEFSYDRYLFVFTCANDDYQNMYLNGNERFDDMNIPTNILILCYDFSLLSKY